MINNFFGTTFDLDSEKQKIIDFINMKKNQDASEAVFFDKPEYLPIGSPYTHTPISSSVLPLKKLCSFPVSLNKPSATEHFVHRCE